MAVLDDLDGRVVLIGSSMGAWLATHATIRRSHKIEALMTIAAAPDFTEKLLWTALSTHQQNAIRHGERVSVPTDYDDQPWRIRRCLFDSGRELALLDDEAAFDLNLPVRMLHGTHDKDVPWALSEQLLNKFKYSNDASLTLLRGADHRLSDENSLRAIRTTLEQLVNEL